MKREAFVHSKVTRQTRKPKYTVIGILESLRRPAARETPQVNARKLSDDIAACIEWDGPATELISALVDYGCSFCRLGAVA